MSVFLISRQTFFLKIFFFLRAENDKLKASLRKKDDELATLKSALERFTNATTKNTLSEIEKRERRAMERKISEMEEELKVNFLLFLFKFFFDFDN